MSLDIPRDAWPHLPPEVPFEPGRPEPPSTPRPPAPPPTFPSWEEADLPPADSALVDRLLEQRIVHVGGRLDGGAAGHATAQLLLLGSRDPGRPVELHLSCPESTLDASLALADSVALLDAPVRVIVHGTLGGPAVAVLCSAEERRAHRRALIVLSVPRVPATGLAAEAAARAEQYERQVQQVAALVAATTDRPPDEVEGELRAGRVLTAQQALDQGLLSHLV